MSELKIEKSYNPKIGFDFFYSDPHGDGFVYFKSEQERDKAANDAISDYLQDGWANEVEYVTVGKITGVTAKVDVTIRPTQLDEDNCDEAGVYWDPDWDYNGNYELKPVGFACPTYIQPRVGV